MNNDQKIQQLEEQVRELMTWKDLKTRQQLSFPLDQISKDIISKDLPVFQSKLFYTRANGTQVPFGLVCRLNGNLEFFSILPTLHVYTVDTGTDIFTSALHGFVNDDVVSILTSDTVPTGILEGIGYYIISATANTFKLSLTSGGGAINITGAGSGIQYIFYN